MTRWPDRQIRASYYSGHDLPELKPIAFVGSIPTKWQCTDCGKRFSLPAMTEQEMNPKVAVYKLFERHECRPQPSRSTHKSPVRKLTETRRHHRPGTGRRATD